jgi:hypothetical protein
VNLSVKLITALAAFVLLVVGLVGLTSSGSTARAAVDAKVYVANEWSNLTNDPTPQTGYTYAGSGKTVYTTFVEVNDATGTRQSTIAGTLDNNANRVTIFVEDADVNVALAKTVSVSGAVTGSVTAGAVQIVVIASGDSPIVDADGDGQVSDDVTVTAVPAGSVVITGATAGATGVSGTVSLITTITGTVTSVELGWSTSSINSLVVKVTTTQNSTGKTFSITETGASTGVFKGTIDLIDVQRGSTPSTDSNAAPHTTADGGTIAIQNGGTVTVEYSDDSPASGSSTAKKITSTATAESGAPLVTITTPANGSATQVLRPAFAGTASDTTSGLDVSEIFVFIDESDDATNTGTVDASKGSTTDENTPTLPAGSADGTTSTTLTLTPGADLPKDFTGTTPDHIVDWQIQATDLAGNIGWTDSSSTKANTAGRGQPHTVKIDRTLPGITNAYTGLALDNTVSPVVRKANVKNSIEINFNDDIDGATIQNTDFEVVISGVTQVPDTAVVGGTGFKDRVFLTLGSDLATKDAPTVKIVGSIADAAGNTTSTGSKVGKDAISPTITVALSGGSSATSPATLTKAAMTITVTSDENLSADPSVEIYNVGTTASAEGTVTAVNQGSNQWVATFSGGSFDGTGATGKKKSVRVTATDAAATVAQVTTTLDGDTTVPATVTVGQTIKGSKSTTASGAVTFTLDKTAPTLTLSPSGTTSDNSPFVRWDFGEVVTVSKAEFGVSTATLTDVTTELGTSDSKTYIRATSGLALATYKATGTATDSAGNKATGLSGTFTIAKRAEFKLTVLPGTTLVSFPLTPADASINAVFSPAGIVSVSSYDTATGTFASSVRDATSGDLAGNLASVTSGVGYIVVADAVSALVVPIPSLTASSIPPSIALASGWNLVGVTDVAGGTGGALQQPGTIIKAGSSYFPSKVTQVYSWNATAKVWEQLSTRTTTGTTNVVSGEAYWAFATAADVIVP